jgi:hypothetical protein
MSLAPRLQRLLAEIRGNSRLRLGLLAIGGILCLYLGLLLQEQAERAEVEQARLAARVARERAAAAEAEWLQRAEAARALRSEAEARLWQAGSLGLAQAVLRDWLEQAAQQAGLAKLQLAVAGQEQQGEKDDGGVSAGLWKAGARLSFEFNPRTLQTFLRLLREHRHDVIVENLQIRGVSGLRAEVAVAAWFHRPADKP